MGTFRIGEAELEIRMIGAGVRNGRLPEPEVRRAWDLTLDEARDLAAFQESGWQFLSQADIDWGSVRKINDKDVEAGLLGRHEWGGLVIVRNHIVVTLRQDHGLPPFDPETTAIHPVSFADDLFDLYLRLPDRDLEGTIHGQLAFCNAFDGSTIGEPLVSYHVVPHGRVVEAKTDPFTQWHWDKIQLETAWNESGTKGQGIRVAVIDRGFHADEMQISSNTTAFVDDMGKYIPGRAVPRRSHGTSCAGLVSALNDGIGVNGAAPESIRLLIAVQSATTQLGVAGAIALATKGFNGAPGADVISCSLGPNARPWELSAPLQTRIDHAHRIGRRGLGIPIFWADFDAAQPIPSTALENYGGIVCVGHTDQNENVAPCGFGPGLDLVAPGVALPCIVPYGTTSIVGLGYGASLAAPCTAGIAALILSMKPGLYWQEVVKAIKEGCDPQATPKVRIDDVHGWGRLNALNAVKVAQTL